MFWVWVRQAAWLAAMSLLTAALLRPQTPEAHLTGLISDATGGVVPRASVMVLDVERHIERRVFSNEAGYYSVPFLNPGLHRVVVEKAGFRPFERFGLNLEVGQVARLDFVLQVGTISEAIRVNYDEPLIESERVEMGQVIDNKRIVEMPLSGRNYLELARFSVGVLPSRQFGRGARSGEGGGFVSVGVHAAQNNVLLDGNDNSSRTSGGALGFEAQAVTPPVDALSQFRVITNNTSAEYGYRAGAKVLVSTKSGTNNFHGSLYHFLRNDKLDGTNFFANRSGAEKPAYRRNQFGGTIGGPLVKDRSFFFFSYQGTRIRLGESSTSSVPGERLRAGDTSTQPAGQRDIFDPFSTTGSGAVAVRQPFPGNTVPRSRWDPVAAAVIAAYPAPNIAGRAELPDNYFHSASRVNNADEFDLRVDHNITSAHHLFVRYSLRNQNKVDPGPLPLPADGGLWTLTRLDGDNVAATLASSFGAAVFNELRFGYSHFPTRFDIPYRTNLNPVFGIEGAPGDGFGDGLDYGWSLFQPSGFVDIGARAFWPNQNNLDNLLLADSLLVQKGAHTIKAGGELRRSNIFREAQRFRRGRFTFNGQFTAQYPNDGGSRAETGNAMADFLLGLANSRTYGNAQGENLNARYLGLFIQDEWKAASQLTLNLGLRYEIFHRPTFPNPAGQTVGRWLIPGVNGVAPGEERMEFPRGSSDGGGPADRNNFAPRFGLAYRLRPHTVLRVGGGIYYGEADSSSLDGANFRSGPPGHTEVGDNASRTEPSIRVRDGFPALATGVIPNNVTVYVFPAFRPTLYSGQWFADLQRELPWGVLLTAGYNGQSSTHLAKRRNLNHPRTPDATVKWQDRKPRPGFNGVILTENSLNSSYHAFTLKAEKRFADGLTFLSSFTWSHNVDYGEETLFQGGSGSASDYELWRDRGDSSLDRRLAYAVSLLWELPFGAGERWLNGGLGAQLLGGWSIGSIVTTMTGQPLDHSYRVDHQNNGGRIRGDWVRNPNLPASERTIDRWFDPGFVTASAPGVIGNAGRNLIRSPGRTDWDFVLSRRFAMPWEGHVLQFRAEAFNLTNSAHFAPPNTEVGSPNAGRITSADEPRRVQFGLKYIF